ncbi:hypothetical protein SAMN05421538_101247 [Paracoccus isoporae]|uniref:Hemolysin n=1 Tax=Paracoccus isoporae TaxID=591205 RepID=A0A1G6TE27_9RHOB|nr:DUF333 domain-containing protein [Paracoccus isoporae]SDD26687.1 hypothetical protein SAMN05421538_101247 [Paracoccus isoporae]
MRLFIALPALLALTACGGGSSTPRQSGASAGNLPLTPSVLYCQRSGGEVIPATAGGRRADLCRLPGGRTVRAADLLNSHNTL